MASRHGISWCDLHLIVSFIVLINIARSILGDGRYDHHQQIAIGAITTRRQASGRTHLLISADDGPLGAQSSSVHNQIRLRLHVHTFPELQLARSFCVGYLAGISGTSIPSSIICNTIVPGQYKSISIDNICSIYH